MDADFAYSILCRQEQTKGDKSDEEEEMREIPGFTKKRCRLPSTASKKGKASDSNGIRAENIKTCADVTKVMVRLIFNEVTRQKDCTPETWRII